jgi:hypothetical protein
MGPISGYFLLHGQWTTKLEVGMWPPSSLLLLPAISPLLSFQMGLGLNSGLYACKVGALLLELHLQSFLLLSFPSPFKVITLKVLTLY